MTTDKKRILNSRILFLSVAPQDRPRLPGYHPVESRSMTLVGIICGQMILPGWSINSSSISQALMDRVRLLRPMVEMGGTARRE